MAFKKFFMGDKPIVINSSETKELFPPGFCYRLGGIVRTVKADVTQEASSPMREVSLSDGATEIIPIESLVKDMKEEECQILPMDERYVIKKAEEEEKPKKVAKVKKKKKKKTKKNK